jgi:hypothetical protein
MENVYFMINYFLVTFCSFHFVNHACERLEATTLFAWKLFRSFVGFDSQVGRPSLKILAVATRPLLFGLLDGFFWNGIIHGSTKRLVTTGLSLFSKLGTSWPAESSPGPAPMKEPG